MLKMPAARIQLNRCDPMVSSLSNIWAMIIPSAAVSTQRQKSLRIGRFDNEDMPLPGQDLPTVRRRADSSSARRAVKPKQRLNAVLGAPIGGIPAPELSELTGAVSAAHVQYCSTRGRSLCKTPNVTHSYTISLFRHEPVR